MTLTQFKTQTDTAGQANRRFAPLRRIKPTEGMMVTETIWDEAHEFHRQQLRLHGLYAHGAGILTGLQVIASDPADREVYVLPGVAQDSAGNVIVVPRPVAFSLGNAQGELRLVLGYGESEPRNEKLTSEDNALRIQSEFLMETRPVQENDGEQEAGFVEIARIQCVSAAQPITNAANAARPGAQEIDLRFRKWIGATSAPALRIGAVALGGANGGAAGVRALAQSMRALRNWRAWVDEDIVIGNTLSQYHLVCLFAAGAFQLGEDAVQRFRKFIDNGGTLFAEASGAGLNTPARDSFQKLFGALKLRPEAAARGDALLSIPHVFGTGVRDLLTCDGLIYSAAGYARLWQGESDQAPASREDIRAAHELGENILTCVYSRAQSRLTADSY